MKFIDSEKRIDGKSLWGCGCGVFFGTIAIVAAVAIALVAVIGTIGKFLSEFIENAPPPP